MAESMTRRIGLATLPAAVSAAQARNGLLTKTVQGKFTVQLTPLDMEGEKLGRMKIDKQFHGPLDAKSLGQMLSAMTGTKGSAVYVAIERVDGRLDGRTGSFVLHHRGIMDRGQSTLSVDVAPDSATGELAGLTGSMKIIIEKGEHSYEFTYTLPEP